MTSSQQFNQILRGLAALGPRRLVMLSVTAVLMVAAILFASHMLTRPTMQSLYTGLTTQDANRIATALADAGIVFDVSSDRSAVLVPVGQAAKVRALLAQRGLPAHATSGYELFDKLGSLGLTSFMQEVTRVRALEGEIARTVQSLDGVEASRVHLVLADPGSFRTSRRDASASVVVRTGPAWQPSTTVAIRSLVASAVAGMRIESVSVTSADGRVLATGGDERSLASHKLNELESTIARTIEERASKTLAPMLGLGHFQVSASVRLDMDRMKVAETTFDPESRVERSIRVDRRSNVSENQRGEPVVGVEANVPQEPDADAPTQNSSRKDDRRQETINFELNSKRIETERQGYRIAHMAVAVVLNRERVAKLVGDGATDEQIGQKIAELKKLITAATGADQERGDKLEMAAIEFDANNPAITVAEEPGLMHYLAVNAGTIINAVALIIVAFLVFGLGMRPLLAAIGDKRSESGGGQTALGSDGGTGNTPTAITSDTGDDTTAPGIGSWPMASGAMGTADLGLALDGAGSGELSVGDRLNSLLDTNEKQMTQVLREWLQEEEAA